MISIRGGRGHKLKEWTRRYLPAEVLGSGAAVTAAWMVQVVSGSRIGAAIAGSIGETLGYYSCIAFRDLRRYRAHQSRSAGLWPTGTRAARDLLIEFGPAELVDSLLARPFFMYSMPMLIHNFTVGLVAGKLAADVVFYSLAIASYELKKQYPPLIQPKEK
jgi:hypothetical protein